MYECRRQKRYLKAKCRGSLKVNGEKNQAVAEEAKKDQLVRQDGKPGE